VAGYNILCSRLFVAECEPGPQAVPPRELVESLVTDSVYPGQFEFGVRARDCLYLKPLNSIMALPEQPYLDGIKAELSKLRVANPAYKGDRKRSVFISRRFIETKGNIDPSVRETYERILEALAKGIQEAGWAMSSAPPDYAGKTIHTEIYPRLWVSDALIVVAFYDDGSGRLSFNQAHELGFYMGQSKPTAILVDNARIQDLNVSNYVGRQNLDYVANVAFNDSDPGSISARVRTWLEKVARDL
jgi:hypothetical protein